MASKVGIELGENIDSKQFYEHIQIITKYVNEVLEILNAASDYDKTQKRNREE